MRTKSRQDLTGQDRTDRQKKLKIKNNANNSNTAKTVPLSKEKERTILQRKKGGEGQIAVIPVRIPPEMSTTYQHKFPPPSILFKNRDEISALSVSQNKGKLDKRRSRPKEKEVEEVKKVYGDIGKEGLKGG